MEIVMATSIWETFDDSDLSIEHLQVCDNEESNISREYIYELMAQIDPETADVAKEQYEKEHATAKRHKLFSILIPIALGIVLFILASVLNKVPGFAALYVLGAIAIIAGIINLVYPLLKSDD